MVMMCRDIMKVAKSVEPGLSVQEAAAIMRDAGVGFLPVCEEGTIVGTVTDRDMAVRLVAEGASASEPVETIMSRDTIVCRAEEDIRQAEELMGQHKVSRILCVDEYGALEGVISLSDIAQIEQRSQAADTLRDISQREGRI
jgi:CBS domain-containing protein